MACPKADSESAQYRVGNGRTTRFLPGKVSRTEARPEFPACYRRRGFAAAPTRDADPNGELNCLLSGHRLESRQMKPKLVQLFGLSLIGWQLAHGQITSVPVPVSICWTNPPADLAVFARRASNVVQALRLDSPAVRQQVGQVLFTNLVVLSRWYDAHGAELQVLRQKLASAPDDSEAKAVLDLRVAELVHWKTNLFDILACALTPEQLETVKDKLTQDRLTVTYRAYCAANTNLTEAQKAHILELLRQAREEALVAGSAEEKNAVFRRYKGRINNYLATERRRSTDANPNRMVMENQ